MVVKMYLFICDFLLISNKKFSNSIRLEYKALVVGIYEIKSTQNKLNLTQLNNSNVVKW